MKLLRFISDDEMKLLLNDEIISSINSYKQSETSLGSKNIVYFLSMEDVEEYMEAAEALPPSDMLSTDESIAFFNVMIYGIVDNDFAVIVNAPDGSYIEGVGTYAHPGWCYGKEDIFIDDKMEVREIGIKSYSLDDVVEIWTNDGNGQFSKIK